MLKAKALSIATSNLCSSFLFYVEMLGLDVLDSYDGMIKLSGGIDLYSKESYIKRYGFLKQTCEKNSLVIEFETDNIDNILFKINSFENQIEYKATVIDDCRALIVKDPDGNTIAITEAKDRFVKDSYSDNESFISDKFTSTTVNGFVFSDNKRK